MFGFPVIMISYPDEASGWQNGVYHERVRRESEIPAEETCIFAKEAKLNDVIGAESTTDATICRSQLSRQEVKSVKLKTRMWTETESTGFGIYPYVDGPAFVLDTGIRDVEISLAVSNPTDKEIRVSCFANDILKLNGAVLEPFGKAEYKFSLCSIEEKTIIQPFVPSDAKTADQADVAELVVEDISFTYLPAKEKKEKPTIFLASDSTVQSYDRFHYPQAGWGQVFYRFFNNGNLTEEQMSPDMMYPQNHIYETPGANIENRSIGARSSRSFINEGKWDMLLARTAPGDFCFIQWGHNDATAVRPNRYVAPADFAWWLKKYTRSCRARGVVPVLVTPIARRNCDNANGTFVASFGKYADVMIALGKEENVPVIDLCGLSVDYLNSIGPEESKLIYLWAAPDAYPDSAYAGGVSDNTHLQEYGATIYAGLVAKAILDSDNPEFDVLRPLINTEFEIAKPALCADPIPADSSAPQNFAMQELHIENNVASFLLTFSDVEGAVKYRVYRKGSVDFQFFPLREVTAEEKSTATVLPFTIPAADVYEVYVAAVFADGQEGAPSRTIEFRA
ncbi:MAG: rhamnogalacturonan acetylesterase [Lachnospiraceae bacterium]|nr:rhamnogalacturonan acetylesterase [Lachnospiraceae bacterium]